MYFNTEQQIASAMTASASFTTDFTFRNFDNGAVQVVWAGVDTNVGTFRLQCSVNGTDFSNLTTIATTMTTASSSQVFNITDAGYDVIRCVYAAVSNTVGTVDVFINRKSRR